MLLELNNIDVRYARVPALRDVSLQVDQGEIVCLIGANGAGKTTTLRAISGIHPIHNGSIRFRDETTSHLAPHQLVALGMSHVPEGRGVFPGMSVLENLQMGAYTRSRAPRDELERDYERIYHLFPVLKERRKQAGGTLSGGEQQMLAMGRALMARPQLLLLDEPSMGLAPMKVRQIFEIISAIREQGTTVLIVEQNAVQALRQADRAYVLERGRVVRSAPAAELLDDRSIREAYLGST